VTYISHQVPMWLMWRWISQVHILKVITGRNSSLVDIALKFVNTREMWNLLCAKNQFRFSGWWCYLMEHSTNI